jgi:hypothetical protein
MHVFIVRFEITNRLFVTFSDFRLVTGSDYYFLICPLPSMQYFVVVKCWTLMGPLA